MTEILTVKLDELEHDPSATEGHMARLQQLDDLLASLPHEGQIQSLRVRPFAGKAPKKGAAPKWWVIAGNRRLASLRKLRDMKAKIQGVAVTGDFPVHVIAGEADDAGAYASSRSENLMRLPETPVEEFRAFAKMATSMSAKEIAGRFGITEKRVKQRLSLAALHEDVLAALEAGKITMEAAQAFTIEPDPKRQAAYLKKAPSYRLDPHSIKAAFTEKLIRSDSAIAKLIGKKAYEGAGGQILGDAFGSVAYWISPEVVDQLVDARMAEQKQAWLDEGWLFVESNAEFLAGTGLSYLSYADQLHAAPNAVPARLKAEYETATARIAELEKQYPEAFDENFFGSVPPERDPSDELQDEFGELQDRVEAIENEAGRALTAEQRAQSGVVYWSDGTREPELGMVKPSGRSGKGGSAEAPPATLDDVGPTLSEKLALQMTAALRSRVQVTPHLALRVLVGTLTAQTAMSYSRGMPLRIMPEHRDKNADDAKEPTLTSSLEAVRNKTVDELLDQLAVLVASNINLGQVRDPMTATTPERKRALSDFIDVDPTAAFDVDGYFAAITKPLIQLAWTDMGSCIDFQEKTLKEGKKADMAKRAAEKARAQGWLPPQLRTPSYDGPALLDEGEDIAQAAE